ncbi:MAG: hypothetical protein AMK69_20485 [Nitrospira bacterium SG8_3]|nr:MAG: hypothetical protein AMK69_20485 [Nitrospira bacterium SG8_3]
MIDWEDRWKLRYAGFPRLRLGSNGKPSRTKMSLLIFVPHGFPFFQAIQPSQFLEYLRNLRSLPAIASMSPLRRGGRVCVQKTFFVFSRFRAFVIRYSVFWCFLDKRMVRSFFFVFSQFSPFCLPR